MALSRPLRWRICWTLIQRAITVGLVLAFMLAPVAAYHFDDHGNANDKVALVTADSGLSKEPGGSRSADNCHVSGSCAVLAIPQADFTLLVVAPMRETFGGTAPHWHGLVVSPTARPPII